MAIKVSFSIIWYRLKEIHTILTSIYWCVAKNIIICVLKIFSILWNFIVFISINTSSHLIFFLYHHYDHINCNVTIFNWCQMCSGQGHLPFCSAESLKHVFARQIHTLDIILRGLVKSCQYSLLYFFYSFLKSFLICILRQKYVHFFVYIFFKKGKKKYLIISFKKRLKI